MRTILFKTFSEAVSEDVFLQRVNLTRLEKQNFSINSFALALEEKINQKFNKTEFPVEKINTFEEKNECYSKLQKFSFE